MGSAPTVAPQWSSRWKVPGGPESLTLAPRAPATIRQARSSPRLRQTPPPPAPSAGSIAATDRPVAASIARPVAQPVVSTPPAGAMVPQDPFVQAPTAIWYVRPKTGGQYGPATNDIMRSWLAEGRIGVDSLVWREGWSDWQEAGGVFPQLRRNDTPAFVGGPVNRLAMPAPVVSPVTAKPAKSYTGLIIAALVIAVVVLVIVFALILSRQPAAAPKENAASTTKAAWSSPSQQPSVRIQKGPQKLSQSRRNGNPGAARNRFQNSFS